MKENSTKRNIAIMVIAVLTPILGMALYMLKYKVGVGDISIACSDWNDELWYYKMIEAMVHYGLPQGYYGYNESHAIWGNLGGWSIAMYLPFVAIGKLVGWNYMTPVVINLVLWLASFVLFAVALRPSLKQQVFVSLVWLSYSINIRYIFSATPETLITVCFLWVAIAFVKLYKNPKSLGWLIFADVVLVYLTLMRGYYILFIVCILAILYNDSKKISLNIIIQVIVALVAAVGFVLIVHFCLAEYFVPDINTEWLTHPKAFVKLNLMGFIESLQYMWEAVLLKNMRGSWYIIYLLVVPFIIRRCIKNKNIVDYSLLFSWVALIIAMWTLYTAKEGCRHLMAYCMIAVMLIAYSEVQLKASYIIIAVLMYTTWFSKDSFFNALIPKDEKQMEALADGYEKLSKELELSDEPWDNTIISTRITYSNDMYAIPEGFALNSCLDDYVRENWDELNSKYIAYRPEGDLNDFLAERCEVIATFGDTVVYQIR